MNIKRKKIYGISCPICEKNNLKKKAIKIKESKSNIYSCLDCSFDFLNTWNDRDFVKSLYENDNYLFHHNIDNQKED